MGFPVATFSKICENRTAKFPASHRPFEARKACASARPKAFGENIRSAELDIPRELAAYRPKISNISAFILPGQEMANCVQKEIAIASAKDPPVRAVLESEAF